MNKKGTYKIIIYLGVYGYVAFLYKRKLFIWWEIEYDHIEYPFGRTVINWQEKYNIPDERVKFNI